MSRGIVVVQHAVDQYRQRMRDDRSDEEIKRLIADAVHAAFQNGRLRNHKIDSFVLYHGRRKQLPEAERFVWAEDESVGWIVRRKPDKDIVTTTLKRTSPTVKT